MHGPILQVSWHDYQNDNIVTVRNKEDFEVTECDQVSTLEGIFLPVSGMHGLILVILVTVTHYQISMTLMTFLRSRVPSSRSQTTFFRNALFTFLYTD